MMTMKFGGVLITGVAAFLLANKALNVIDNSTKRICEASKWKNYYKCMNNDKSSTEQIVPPGYSIKTTSESGDTDGDNVSRSIDDDLAKAIASFCKEVAKKSIDSLKKPPETRTEATEGQGEASESETCEDSEKVTDDDIFGEAPATPIYEVKKEDEGTWEKVTEVDEDGNPVAGRYSWKETDKDETVD